MSWLDKLEKRLRPFAVPGVTVFLIAGQTLVYVAARSKPAVYQNIQLIPERVFAGELWRVVTFVFDPPAFNLLFAIIAWYLFYLMGDALEHQWGVARYNIYLLIAYVATLAAAFLGNPQMVTTNVFIAGSVFLAFAHLFPDFQLLLFFILPVKVKWLGLIMWISYIYSFVMGSWTVRGLVLAATGNFLLFFGREILLNIRSRWRRLASQAEEIKRQEEPVHSCVVCGVSDKDDPAMDFRYCSKCVDSPCYCGDHIRDHRHRT